MKNRFFLYLLLSFVLASFAHAAEEETKNTHFFPTLSRYQLRKTMNFMRGSLGVHCDFCHVVDKTNGWQWEKDDKPTKIKAREMIEMVQGINEKYFHGSGHRKCRKEDQ